MKINQYPKVTIEWVDILGDTAWSEEDEFKNMKCSTCVSQGYLIFKNDEVLMTFASYEAEDGEIISFGDRNVYPIGCIKKIEYL